MVDVTRSPARAAMMMEPSWSSSFVPLEPTAPENGNRATQTAHYDRTDLEPRQGRTIDPDRNPANVPGSSRSCRISPARRWATAR